VDTKTLLKLTHKKYRRELGICIIEGEKIVREHAARAKAIFLREQSSPPVWRGGTPAGCDGVVREMVIPTKLFDSISSLETTHGTQGILAVVPIPKPTEITFPYLVLDGIQDPGNMGTLLRTAAAFGFNTVFAINSADVWSQKVLRAGVGTQFSLNIYELNHDEFMKVFETQLKDSTLHVADVNHPVTASPCHPSKEGSESLSANYKKVLGKNEKETNSPLWRGGTAVGSDGVVSGECEKHGSSSFGLALGSEGQGISPQIKSLPHKVVTIPIKNAAESLNVAVAGGIIMHGWTQ